MGTQEQVISILKKLQSENQNPLCLELELDSTDTLLRKYFLNYRGGNPEKSRGLRLTDSGLLVLQCFFKSYQIELQSDYKPKIKHTIYLDRHCKMPWHLKNNFLTFFEEELAFKTKLVGDLELLVSNFKS